VIDRYCTVLDAMRDEPTGGLDLRGGATTPAVVRSSEKSVELRHHRRHVMCAVHEASGALVAVTRVEVHDDFDEAAQGATAVIAEHRGRGLARWLKSAMLVQLAESEPHVTNIRTGTAPVNVHMRRINETLGFRPVLALAEFQRTLPREAPNP
jgi:GNAT superfamily N-acetyltransferase